MNGERVLRHRARNFRRRVDQLLSLYAYACLTFFIVAIALSVVLWSANSKGTSISLVVLSVAVTGYLYSTLLQRQQHIKDITDKTVDTLRGRWDELRKDSELLQLLASDEIPRELPAMTKLKVRLYVSTVLDMYAVIIYYINHGYFEHTERFALIYEEMLKSFLRWPGIAEVWHSKDVWGMGCIRNEYDCAFVDIVDGLIDEIKIEQISIKPHPPEHLETL